MPLTELSPASAPSTLTKFERWRAPLTLNPLLGAGPMVGETSRVVFENKRVKSKKLRAVDRENFDQELRDRI